MSDEDAKGNSDNIDFTNVERLIIAFGYHIRNSLTHAWFSDDDIKQALIDNYELLAMILSETAELLIQVNEDKVIVNGHLLKSNSEQVSMFAEHMADLDIPNFVLSAGITRESLEKLLDILDARPFEIRQLGGFNKVLVDFNVDHVSTRDIKMVTITSEQSVIDGQAEKTAAKKKKKKTQEPVSEETVGNVLAFLKGEGGGTPGASKEVNDTASDPEKMAELILQAADVQQQVTPIEQGETLMDFVVGCLRKTHEAMTGDKAAQTKTGRKRITKNLLLLEEQLLDQMRATSSDWTEEDLELISEATMQATDEMKIDSLANELVAARETELQSQNQLAEILQKANGDGKATTAIHDRLASDGLTDSDWHELVLKSRGESGIGFGGGGDIARALEHLDGLLNTITSQMDTNQAEEKAQTMSSILESIRDISLQASNLVIDVNARVAALSRKLSADSESDTEKSDVKSGASISRKELVHEFSELSSGLTPVVHLILSAVDAINTSAMGKLSSQQSEMVKLVRQNISETKTALERISTLG